ALSAGCPSHRSLCTQSTQTRGTSRPHCPSLLRERERERERETERERERERGREREREREGGFGSDAIYSWVFMWLVPSGPNGLYWPEGERERERGFPVRRERQRRE